VLPLVFCENRNIGVLKQAFEEELGFATPQIYRRQVAEFAKLYQEGRAEEIQRFRSDFSRERKGVLQLHAGIGSVRVPPEHLRPF